MYNINFLSLHKKEMENEAKKRKRRTKKELEDALWNTLEKQIIEKGFDNITITGLAKEAGFEPLVIYNRFKNVDELFERYIRKYDYWLNGFVNLKKENNARENFKKLLVDLINELYDNEIMQRLLLWGLNDTKKVTRQMSLNREINSSALIQYFCNELENFDGVGSLMISGIYYLILHRKVSTFSTIDYNTPQGRERMIETVESILNKLFPTETPPIDIKIMDVAKKLLEKGVDKDIVREVIGLSIKEIDALIIE